MLIDNWIEKGFILKERMGNKFFWSCIKGHDFSIWKARLGKIYCPVCEKADKKNEMLQKRCEAFHENNWVEVQIEDNIATVTCEKNHTTTRTLYKTDPCFECKQEKDFEEEKTELKKLASGYGLKVKDFIRRTPRNTSSIVVECNKGHKRKYIFSQFKYLEVMCSKCELVKERKQNRKLEVERYEQSLEIREGQKLKKKPPNPASVILKKAHQRIIREDLLKEDLDRLGKDILQVKLDQYSIFPSIYTKEHKEFIERYEWLGTVGNRPKWIFEARCKNHLAGVILLNEPIAYSKLLRDRMPYEIECLIQRGASASWTTKNLGSKLITFAIKWMLQNTTKRVFIGYADPLAGEIGTIYQALGFDYLGDSYGSKYQLEHKDIKKGQPYSPLSLNRTSSFKKWAKMENITLQKNWFKPNGYKDLLAIPENIKLAWKQYIKRIEAESEKIPIPTKGKYVLVTGLHDEEKNSLNELKAYTPKPYPKRST